MQEANEEFETLKERAELIPKPPKGKRRYIDILLHNMTSSPRLLEPGKPEKQVTAKSKRKSTSRSKKRDLRKS
jgi:hypothetical protein